MSASKRPLPPPHRQLDRLRNIVAILCGSIIVVLWTVLYQELAHDNAQYAENSMRSADNLALAFERHVDASIKTIDMAMLRLRETMHHGRDRFDWTARAITQDAMRDMLVYVAYIGSDGRIVDSTLPNGIGIYLGDREYFVALQLARDDRLHIGQALLGRASGQWQIPFARRVETPAGKFAGVLMFAVRPDFFSGFYTSVNLGPQGVATLVHDGGTMLARGSRRQGPENAVGQAWGLHPPLAGNAQSVTWTHQSAVDGVTRVGAYRHHRDYPLAVYVGLAREDELTAYDLHVRETVATGCALTAVVIALGIWLFRLYQRLQIAQQATEEGESRFRRLYMQAPLAYQSLDHDGRIIDVNEPWTTLFGHCREEVIGRPIGEFIGERSHAAWAHFFTSALESGEEDGIELEIRRGDGSLRLVAVRSRVDRSGMMPQAHCIVHDITAAHQQEALLKASEARLRGIVDNVGVVTWELDLPAWTYAFVSPQVENMFGYPARDWLEPGFWSRHVHPEERERIRRTRADCLAKGKDHDLEYRFLGHGGRIVWVRDIVKVITGANGEAVKLTGVMVDISQAKEAEDELRRSEHKLRSYVSQSADGICVLGNDLRYLEANPALSEMLGLPEWAMLGQSFEISFADDSTEHSQVLTLLGQLISEGRCRGQCIGRRADGARLVVEINATTLEPGRHLVLVRDMTERWAAAESQRLAEAVFMATTEGITVTDVGGRILSTNPAFTTITGWRAEEALGQNPRILKSGRHGPEFYAEVWRQINACGTWQGEIWNRRKNGDLYAEWLSINAIRNAAGETTHFVAVFSDITERKRQEETIWQQANFDALTGLANRNLFHDRLEHALAVARRNQTLVGLMFIDLDRFKWINDTLGHDAGDRLLIEAAHRLDGCVREEDTVARLGGDEFTIVLQGLGDPEPMKIVAEKVLQSLAAPFRLDDDDQYISGSVGITVFPNDGPDASTLLRNADIAMYRAKLGGKNRYEFYSQSMQAEALARIQLEQELRQAIDERALMLHYQPIVSADDGRLVGAEALLRWQHPARGLLLPGEFLSVAEEAGLIVPLSDWVIGQACRQWREWIDAGQPSLFMSINVSSTQFRTRHLHDTLAREIAHYGIPPDRLMLEVTESLLLESNAAVEESLAAIKRLGIRFALDDFGTGYSSLASLKRFPVDVVKLDRGFVSGCADDGDDARLVEAIVFMAHSFNLRVCAEGVETPEQRRFLRSLDCNLIQGYLISPPLAPERFCLLHRRPSPSASEEECLLGLS